MKFCSIASGSSGNCIYAGSAATSVLIDAGISGRRIEQGLSGIDQAITDIDGILVTHEHSDHIKGIGVLARKYGIPVYGTPGTLHALKENTSVGKIPDDLMTEIRAGEMTEIGDLAVMPFAISHDAAEPVGYRISHNGKSAAVATDMGCYDNELIDRLKDLDVLLLESNHDVHMLQAGRYPYYLKRRIMSDKGHLSNESAGQLLSLLLHDGIRQVCLGHLSRENNYEALAYETVCSEVTLSDTPYRAGDFHITIAHRDRPEEPVIF